MSERRKDLRGEVQRRDDRRPCARAPFRPGATLVLYTDGLVERRGRDIAVGLDALETTVAANLELDVEALGDAIVHDLLERRRADDDAALLVARAVI